MARRLTEGAQALVFVAALLVAIAGLYAAAQLLQPSVVPATSVHSVRLDVKGPGWVITYHASETRNNTAFSILQEAASAFGFPLEFERFDLPPGVFVTAINGSANGEGGRYWQYWVDGVYGRVASDHEGLSDGDTVLWRFSVPEEGG